MEPRVRYPRAFAVFRVALYSATALLAVGLAAITVVSIGAFLAVGAVALLVNGTVDALALTGPVAMVLITLGLLVAGLVAGARRVDGIVRESLHVPDPTDALAAGYVDDEFDEAELERRLERVLDEHTRAGAVWEGGVADEADQGADDRLERSTH